MPRPKPSALTGTAELNAMIERVAPDILALLADGVPRTKAAIVAALAGRHAEPGRDARAGPARGHRAGGGDRRQVHAGAGREDVGRPEEATCSSSPGTRPSPSSGAVLALAGLALAVTGTGSPMFVRRTTVAGDSSTADGLDGRVRRVGLGAVVLGAAVAALALASG